jgi:hypothetical protein
VIWSDILTIDALPGINGLLKTENSLYRILFARRFDYGNESVFCIFGIGHMRNPFGMDCRHADNNLVECPEK